MKELDQYKPGELQRELEMYRERFKNNGPTPAYKHIRVPWSGSTK